MKLNRKNKLLIGLGATALILLSLGATLTLLTLKSLRRLRKAALTKSVTASAVTKAATRLTTIPLCPTFPACVTPLLAVKLK